jgi:two-component system, NarL family, nitrate/nitrite response regulator NarL
VCAVNNDQVHTLLVAHNCVARLGLIKLVEDSEILQLDAVAGDAAQALAELERQADAFDVAVIELAAETAGAGYELTTTVRERAADLPILLISDHASGELAVRVLAAGATGYITTSSGPDEVVDAICRVARGMPVLGSDVGAALVPELRRRTDTRMGLTERELDILKQLADGGTCKEIADRMHLATPTIKNHVAHLYAKLGVRDRGAAVAEAMRHGWLQ